MEKSFLRPPAFDVADGVLMVTLDKEPIFKGPSQEWQELVAMDILCSLEKPGRGAIYRIAADLHEARVLMEPRLAARRVFFRGHEQIRNADYRALFGSSRYGCAEGGRGMSGMNAICARMLLGALSISRAARSSACVSISQYDARRLSPVAQADLRRRVVQAIREQGLSQAEAARTFGVARPTVVVDRHRVHRSMRVRRWLRAHRDEIRVDSLPVYRPEPNPDELLKQDVESNALGRRRPGQQGGVEGRSPLLLAQRPAPSTQHRPPVVMNFFGEEHVRYALAL